jgi:hypothetical protein
MNRWLIGVVVGMFACAAGFLAVTQHLTPPPVERAIEEATARVASSPQVPEPVILSQVVDTADIDPLLDPPEKPITGLPFDVDATPPTTPTETAVPDRIPPAVEEVPPELNDSIT